MRTEATDAASAVPSWGHDELHPDLLYSCKCVPAGLTSSLWDPLDIGNWARATVYGLSSKACIWQHTPLHMLLLLIRFSETYPRIDPKRHAEPPCGEMHSSHCRALPLPHPQPQVSLQMYAMDYPVDPCPNLSRYSTALRSCGKPRNDSDPWWVAASIGIA